MSGLAGIPVPCPNCGETFLETTEDFETGKMTNGTMLRLLPQYGPDGLNWSCFPSDEWILGDALECPGCGAPMGGLEGKVILQRGAEDAHEAHNLEDAGSIPAPATNNDAHVCDECGKIFKTDMALLSHSRVHKRVA